MTNVACVAACTGRLTVKTCSSHTRIGTKPKYTCVVARTSGLPPNSVPYPACCTSIFAFARFLLSAQHLFSGLIVSRTFPAAQYTKVVIRVLGRYGLEGERETEHTGVWVGGAKVAAIGLNASRWVTSHGFALNVNPDLSAFEAIVPCGIQGRPVTRLYDLVGAEPGSPPSPEEIEKAARVDGTVVTSSNAAGHHAIDMDSVRSLVMQEFEGVFGVRMEVVNVDAAALCSDYDYLEREIFPADCEPQLLARLRADSLRQLELTRR